MAMNILLPDGMRPTNLHLVPFQKDENGIPIITKARLVTHDIFMICERMKEISPILYLLELERNSAEGQKFGYAVMEHDPDMDRVIFRVSKDKLDARVLEKLRYIMHLPLKERLDLVEKERQREEDYQAEQASEEAWENIGGPMWAELEKNGFIDQRPVSYRKMNRTARRSMNAENHARLVAAERRQAMAVPTTVNLPAGVRL